jgi:hypothetical protein
VSLFMETGKNPYSKRWYFFWGLFYLALGLFVLCRNYYFSISYYSIFWLCDFAPFVLALGFLMRSNGMIKGVLNIAFFPQIIFLYGAFMIFFFNIDIFGVGLSLEHLTLWFIASSIVLHTSLIAAYFLNYEVRPTYKSLIYSFVLLSVMYFVAVSYTPIEENVNYVFMFKNLGFDALMFLYVPAVFLFVALPTFIFQVLMQRLWKRNHSKP